jgi:hypothetical protein
MTEEQIFKSRFPEYCVGERCLSPYFDLFQIGFEEGEKQNEELREAKTIIQDLLSNSDEYARQRAMDFLKGE